MIDPHKYIETLGNFRLVIHTHPKSDAMWIGFLEREHDEGWTMVWQSSITVEKQDFAYLLMQLRQSRRDYFYQDLNA